MSTLGDILSTMYIYNFEMERWFMKLHSYIMSNKAEPFKGNLRWKIKLISNERA